MSRNVEEPSGNHRETGTPPDFGPIFAPLADRVSEEGLPTNTAPSVRFASPSSRSRNDGPDSHKSFVSAVRAAQASSPTRCVRAPLIRSLYGSRVDARTPSRVIHPGLFGDRATTPGAHRALLTAIRSNVRNAVISGVGSRGAANSSIIESAPLQRPREPHTKYEDQQEVNNRLMQILMERSKMNGVADRGNKRMRNDPMSPGKYAKRSRRDSTSSSDRSDESDAANQPPPPQRSPPAASQRRFANQNASQYAMMNGGPPSRFAERCGVPAPPLGKPEPPPPPPAETFGSAPLQSMASMPAPTSVSPFTSGTTATVSPSRDSRRTSGYSVVSSFSSTPSKTPRPSPEASKPSTSRATAQLAPQSVAKEGEAVPPAKKEEKRRETSAFEEQSETTSPGDRKGTKRPFAPQEPSPFQLLPHRGVIRLPEELRYYTAPLPPDVEPPPKVVDRKKTPPPMMCSGRLGPIPVERRLATPQRGVMSNYVVRRALESARRSGYGSSVKRPAAARLSGGLIPPGSFKGSVSSASQVTAADGGSTLVPASTPTAQVPKVLFQTGGVGGQTPAAGASAVSSSIASLFGPSAPAPATLAAAPATTTGLFPPLKPASVTVAPSVTAPIVSTVPPSAAAAPTTSAPTATPTPAQVNFNFGKPPPPFDASKIGASKEAPATSAAGPTSAAPSANLAPLKSGSCMSVLGIKSPTPGGDTPSASSAAATVAPAPAVTSVAQTAAPSLSTGAVPFGQSLLGKPNAAPSFGSPVPASSGAFTMNTFGQAKPADSGGIGTTATTPSTFVNTFGKPAAPADSKQTVGAAIGGGFSFGAGLGTAAPTTTSTTTSTTTPVTSTPAKPAFSFGTAPGTPFTFGAAKPATSNAGSGSSVTFKAPEVSAAAGATGTPAQTPFNFSVPTTSGTTTSGPAAASSTKPLFTFGAAKQPGVGAPAANLFGAASSGGAAASGAPGFGFGAGAVAPAAAGAATSPASGLFTFGKSTADASKPASTGGFNFGAGNAGSMFKFGGATAAPTSTGQTTGGDAPKPAFAFNAPGTSGLGSGVFTFGAQKPAATAAPTTTTTTAGFNFGSPSAAQPGQFGGFGAGAGSAVAASSPGFGFGAGAQQQSPSTGGFMFGAGGGAGSAFKPQFGQQQQQQPQQQQAGGFSFGGGAGAGTQGQAGATSPSQGFNFGQAAANPALPATFSFTGAPNQGFSFGSGGAAASPASPVQFNAGGFPGAQAGGGGNMFSVTSNAPVNRPKITARRRARR